VPSGFDPVACAGRICDLSILRQLVHLARRVAFRSFAGIEISAKEEISKVWTEIADLRRMAEPEGRADDIRSVLDEAMGQLHHRRKLAEVSGGIAGDAASGGIQWVLRRGTLTILACRHGTDITGLLLRLAARATGSYREDMDDADLPTVTEGAAVRLFSLKDNAGKLGIRLLAARCGVAISAALGGTLHQEDIDRLTAASNDMRHWPLFIDDAPSPSLMEIDARCRRQQRLWGLGIAMVDSIDLVPSPRIADVAHGLRRMASELGIAVVAALHLPVPYRPNLDPTLADLSGFGSLVRHADAVAFVNKPNGPQHDGDGDLQVTVVLDRNGIRGA